MKKVYAPFCVHWYKKNYWDFPICSENFDTLQEALNVAASKHLECEKFRIGCWSSDNIKKAYFELLEIDAQVSLL